MEMKINKKLITLWFMCMVIAFMMISPMVIFGASCQCPNCKVISPHCILPPNCDDEV